MRARTLLVEAMNVISWLNQNNKAIAGFQELTQTLFCLKWILLYLSIYISSISGWRKLKQNLESLLLYLEYNVLCEGEYIWTLLATLFDFTVNVA